MPWVTDTQRRDKSTYSRLHVTHTRGGSLGSVRPLRFVLRFLSGKQKISFPPNSVGGMSKCNYFLHKMRIVSVGDFVKQHLGSDKILGLSQFWVVLLNKFCRSFSREY